MAQIREDLDEPLSVLVRAGSRRECGLEMILVGRCDRRFVTWRSQSEMDDVRRESGVPDEGRMKFERKVRPRDDGVDSKDVRSGPGACCLALSGLAGDR